MEYRTLGRTGVQVSTHCLGAMMFGPWGNDDEDDCVRIVNHALDEGINFIDTADVYSQGRSEQIVGKAIASRRDEVVLATKVHGQMGEGRNRSGNSRRWIVQEVEASLRRLGTDHIDLYQIHRPDPATDIEETLGALTDLVHEGKVAYLGCSTLPAWQIVEAQWASQRRGLERFVCEQPPYSIFVRHIEADVLPVVQQYGMGAIVWSPLAGGWLAGRYRRGQEAPGDSRAKRLGALSPAIEARFDPTLPENQAKLDIVDALDELAAKADANLAQLSIAFTLAHPGVTSAIIGPRTMEQLDDLLAGADLRLEDATLDAIDELVAPGRTLHDADRGWESPSLAAAARRR
ncbi:MAG TPA: aldo/keto reductase [Nitriliruptorales bacterium]